KASQPVACISFRMSFRSPTPTSHQWSPISPCTRRAPICSASNHDLVVGGPPWQLRPCSCRPRPTCRTRHARSHSSRYSVTLLPLPDLGELGVHLVEGEEGRNAPEAAIDERPAVPEIDPHRIEPAAELHFLRVGGLARLVLLGAAPEREPHALHPADEEQ